MRKSIAIILILNSTCFAGFNGLTMHSRANCANNESITWDATRYRLLVTTSNHSQNPNSNHGISSAWQYTWRSAAVHWGEALPGAGWHVVGYHYTQDENARVTQLAFTDVSDCSLYDGWWDRDLENEMKKIVLAAIPTVAIAGPIDMSKLPQPDAGVRIVPHAQISYTQDEIDHHNKVISEINSKGYVEKDNQYAKYLFGIKENATRQISLKSKDVYDTHMKASAKDIKLAFSYKDIQLPNSKVIGYAAVGAYINGWSGIKVFFENKDVGLCSYSLTNMKLTHGAVNISEDTVRYDINKFPNILYIEGKNNSGFLYDIGWYDEEYSKELECANHEYNINTTTKLIDLAKIIEKSK